MSNIDLSIVMLCFNKWNFTAAALKDLSELVGNYELILFDNGSSDETYKNVRSFDEKFKIPFKYIRNEKNLGFAGGCNKAYLSAIGKNVLFLNNDIRVQKTKENWPQEIIKVLKENPHSVVGPTIGTLAYDNEKFHFIKEQDEDILTSTKHCDIHHHLYISGWCIASSRDVWSRLTLDRYDGPWSEEFGLAFFEDSDLSCRCRENNIELKHMNKPPIVHFPHTSARQLNVNKLYSEAQCIFTNKWKHLIK